MPTDSVIVYNQQHIMCFWFIKSKWNCTLFKCSKWIWLYEYSVFSLQYNNNTKLAQLNESQLVNCKQKCNCDSPKLEVQYVTMWLNFLTFSRCGHGWAGQQCWWLGGRDHWVFHQWRNYSHRRSVIPTAGTVSAAIWLWYAIWNTLAQS